MLRALVILALAAIPPLTADERTALDTARDGGDHREAAFVALVEHMRQWPADDAVPGDEPVRLRVDVDGLLADPDAHRGELHRIRGALQQRSPLAVPYAGAEEWFVRDADGTPCLVYVAGTPGAEFADGALVALWARFYKRVDAIARDGRPRSYAAFVGAAPRLVRRGAAPAGAGPAVMLVLLPALIAVFLVVLIAARRRARPRRAVGTRPDATNGAFDEPRPPLPAAPDAALAELRRRAGDAGD